MTAVPRLDRARAAGRRRYVTVLAVLLVIAVVGAVIALTTGSFQASPDDVLAALLGGGDGSDRLIVVDMRLPRALAALIIGAGLGVAGMVFQTLSRNPLGSPDLVGFSAGSATGALVCLVVVTPADNPAVGAWAGGLITLGLVFWLARGSGLARDRTILAGVALAALFVAVNDYLLTRAPLEIARSASLWLHGSLTAVSFGDVAFLVLVIPPVLAGIALLRRPLRMLELGDESARALGVRTGLTQTVLVILAVGLTGAATAVAGPIGFVALAAPQIARRAVGGAGIPMAASGAMGAVLLLLADVLAQRALAPLQIPVGLVTGALGGAYLFWVIARSATSKR